MPSLFGEFLLPGSEKRLLGAHNLIEGLSRNWAKEEKTLSNHGMLSTQRSPLELRSKSSGMVNVFSFLAHFQDSPSVSDYFSS